MLSTSSGGARPPGIHLYWYIRRGESLLGLSKDDTAGRPRLRADLRQKSLPSVISLALPPSLVSLHRSSSQNFAECAVFLLSLFRHLQTVHSYKNRRCQRRADWLSATEFCGPVRGFCRALCAECVRELRLSNSTPRSAAIIGA